MEFERYEDVIDAFEIDNMGYETLTDYIKGNNIRIAEIDMSPMGDLAKAFNKKDGGLMVAVQKFNQGGKAYDPRASVEDMAKAIKTSSAGTDNQKLRMLMDYSMSANPQATPQTVMANQGKMEKLLGLQTNPNFNYMKPSGPALIMPPMESTGFRQDPGYFGNEGIMINGKRYMSEDEARNYQMETKSFEMFRNFLFSRVIPNLSRIGLLTDAVRPKFEALGLLEYEQAPDDFECDWAEMKKPLEKFGQIPEAI